MRENDDPVKPVDSSPLVEFPKSAFTAAVDKQNTLRDFAFIDDAGTEICGVPVRYASLKDILVLLTIGSPFLAGGTGTLAHVLQFLWFLSPDYDPKTDQTPFRLTLWKRVCIFFCEILNLKSSILNPTPYQSLLLLSPFFDLARMNAAIAEYIDETFMDAPINEGPAEAGPAFSSFVASYVHKFGKYYGWSKEQTLRAPVRQIYQLLQHIYQDEGIPPMNPLSDRVAVEHLERSNTPELKQKRAAEIARFFQHA